MVAAADSSASPSTPEPADPFPRSTRPQGRTSRRARGALTRRKLLVAAEESFAAKGFHATRVDDIVKAARISHGTFYLYFANKEAVFAALTETVSAELNEVGGRLPALTPGPAGAAALADWIDEVSQVFTRHGAVIRARAESESAANDGRGLGGDVLGALTTGLAARLATIDPPDPDPDAAALAIVAMIERTHHSLLSGGVTLERERAVRTLARLVHGALFPGT